jgi:hypothetical protein
MNMDVGILQAVILLLIFLAALYDMHRAAVRRRQIEAAMADPNYLPPEMREEIEAYKAAGGTIPYEYEEYNETKNLGEDSKKLKHNDFIYEIESPKPLQTVSWNPKNAYTEKVRQRADNLDHRLESNHRPLHAKEVRLERLKDNISNLPKSPKLSSDESLRPARRLSKLQEQLIAHEIFSGPKGMRRR